MAEITMDCTSQSQVAASQSRIGLMFSPDWNGVPTTTCLLESWQQPK